MSPDPEGGRHNTMSPDPEGGGGHRKTILNNGPITFCLVCNIRDMGLTKFIKIMILF